MFRHLERPLRRLWLRRSSHAGSPLPAGPTVASKAAEAAAERRSVLRHVRHQTHHARPGSNRASLLSARRLSGPITEASHLLRWVSTSPRRRFPPPPPPPPPPNLLTAGSTVTDDVSYGEHGETGLSFSPTKYDKMYIWKSRPNLRCKLVERPDGIAGVPLDRCGLRPADEDSFHTFRKFQISFEQKRGTYVGRDPIRFRLGVLSPSDSLRPGEFLGDLDPDDESTTYCAGADSTHSARDGSKHVYRGRGHEDHRMSHPCGREPLASPVVVVLIHGDRRRRPRLVWVFGLGKELVLIDTIARTTSGG